MSCEGGMLAVSRATGMAGSDNLQVGIEIGSDQLTAEPAGVYRHACRHVCRDICIDICIDMCVSMCVGMCVDVSVGMCVDICVMLDVPPGMLAHAFIRFTPSRPGVVSLMAL